MSGAPARVTAPCTSLRRRGGRYGLATLCVGVGQGQAALFERGATFDADAERGQLARQAGVRELHAVFGSARARRRR